MYWQATPLLRLSLSRVPFELLQDLLTPTMQAPEGEESTGDRATIVREAWQPSGCQFLLNALVAFCFELLDDLATRNRIRCVVRVRGDLGINLLECVFQIVSACSHG